MMGFSYYYHLEIRLVPFVVTSVQNKENHLVIRRMTEFKRLVNLVIRQEFWSSRMTG